MEKRMIEGLLVRNKEKKQEKKKNKINQKKGK